MNATLKFIPWLCLAVCFGLAVPGLSPAQLAPSNAASAAGGAQEIPKAGKTLTDEQIAALLTEWIDPKTQAKLLFSASFGIAGLTPSARAKYVKSGKIPLQIVCQLIEVKEAKGKTLAMRLSGSAHFYILDPDGKTIEKKTVALDKMCSS